MTHNNIAYYAATLQEGANLEQARSNRVREAISDFEAKSQDKYRSATVAINELQQREAARHNAASEALQSRLNEITAEHNARLADIQQRQADIQAESVRNQQRYQTGLLIGNQSQLAETTRHNLAQEAETKSYNERQYGLANVRNFWTGVQAVSQIPGIIIGSAVALKKLKTS